MKTESIQALTTLGLTSSEAIVYLALVKLKKADAKTIYKSAAVARQDIYRILAELQEKGLVEKLVATPAEFRPIPIEWCVPILAERIRNELSKNEKEATNTLRKHKEENSGNALLDEESYFVLVSKSRELLCKRVREMFENTHKSIDISISSKRFHFIGTLFGEDFERALKRGVKFRIIREVNENENPLPESLKILQRHPLFESRYIPDEVPTPTCLADNKRMFIVTSRITCASCEVSTLWTDNPQVVAIFQGYFESLWSTAQESSARELHNNRQQSARRQKEKKSKKSN